jgi:hypothetical protein
MIRGGQRRWWFTALLLLVASEPLQAFFCLRMAVGSGDRWLHSRPPPAAPLVSPLPASRVWYYPPPPALPAANIFTPDGSTQPAGGTDLRWRPLDR